MCFNFDAALSLFGVAADFLLDIDPSVFEKVVQNGPDGVVLHVAALGNLEWHHLVNKAIVNDFDALGVVNELVVIVRSSFDCLASSS